MGKKGNFSSIGSKLIFVIIGAALVCSPLPAQVKISLNESTNVGSSAGKQVGEVEVRTTGAGEIKVSIWLRSGPANKTFYVFIKHDNWGNWTSGSTDSHRDGDFRTDSQGKGYITYTISGSGLTYVQVVVRTQSGSRPAYRYSANTVKTSDLNTTTPEKDILEPTSWPAKISGTDNPEIQWKGPDRQAYRLVLGWKRNDARYLQISNEPTIADNTIEFNFKSGCEGCMARLYIYDVDKSSWIKFSEKQSSTSDNFWRASIPRVGPAEFSSFSADPAKGKILDITNLYSLGGNRVRVRIENKTNYFYGVQARSKGGATVFKSKILGGYEDATLVFNTTLSLGTVFFHDFEIYAQFNLGFFYLQAAYSILFQEPPPTTFLDGIINTIYAEIGTNPEDLYRMDEEALIFLFLDLFKDNPKFRTEVLKVFGKEAAEKGALEAAEKITAIKTLVEEAKALGYLISSFNAEDNETYEITTFKNR